MQSNYTVEEATSLTESGMPDMTGASSHAGQSGIVASRHAASRKLLVSVVLVVLPIICMSSAFVACGAKLATAPPRTITTLHSVPPTKHGYLWWNPHYQCSEGIQGASKTCSAAAGHKFVELVKRSQADIAAAIELFPPGQQGAVHYNLSSELPGYTQLNGVCQAPNFPHRDQISFLLAPGWLMQRWVHGCLGGHDSRIFVAAVVKPPTQIGMCPLMCVIAVHMPHGPADLTSSMRIANLCGALMERCMVAFGDWNAPHHGLTLETQWKSLFPHYRPKLISPNLPGKHTCCFRTASNSIDHLMTTIPRVTAEGTVHPYQILDQNPVEQHHPVSITIANHLGTVSQTTTSQPEQMGVLPLLTVVPYGVLGTRETTSGTIELKAEIPGNEIAVVDPAGLHFIHHFGPQGAGGASGAIYKWLGIDQTHQFPLDVSQGIRASGDAKFHMYGKHMAIHVVGPNLVDLGVASLESEGAAIERLARAYGNVLSEFLVASHKGVQVLRLLPISGGIFSGDFKEELPRLTFMALEQGFSKLPARHRNKLTSSGLRFEMCIWKESDFPKFEAAYVRARSSVAAGKMPTAFPETAMQHAGAVRTDEMVEGVREGAERLVRK